MTRVLIVGAPRSGTTWIGKVLAQTAGSGYVHEPDGMADPFAFRAKLALPSTPALRGDEPLPEYERLWSGAFGGGRRSRLPQDRLARWLFARVTPEEKRMAMGKGQLSHRLRVARAAAHPLVADATKRNVIVKSVHAPLALEWLWPRFEPQVLVVRRHPYNVLASRLEMGIAPGPRDLRSSAELAAREWGVEPVRADDPALFQTAFHLGVVLLAMNDALERHPDWHVVSHEDLCLDPLSGFRKLARRLGLDWTEESETFLHASNKRGTGYATNRVAGEQPGRWRERLTPAQMATIDQALARFPERLLSAF